MCVWGRKYFCWFAIRTCLHFVQKSQDFIKQYNLEIYKELNAQEIIRNSLPSSLRVLLSSRYDLISEGFHKPKNERF